MSELRFEDVTVRYGRTTAVDGVSLAVPEGQVVGLVGESGSGKSTLARAAVGLAPLTSGRITLDGRPVPTRGPRRLQMVFQDPYSSLDPRMTLGESIAEAMPPGTRGPRGRAERRAEVARLLGLVHLDPGLAWSYPGRLSGGQRQRVAMGRAIVRRPGLFLMDEPLSNLDSGLRAELRAEITGLTRELGVTTMYVTHDQAEALTMADRVAIMRKGVLQDLGTPTEVYGRPATLYVAAFLGAPRMNLLEASVYVHLDRYIALNLGEQALYLPWNDIRARAISHYHGERIVVGMRAEALTPVAPDTPGDVLQGRIRYLEHHGHESLAFLDIGATAVVVDELGKAVTDTDGETGALRRLGGALQRLAGRTDKAVLEREDPEKTSVLSDPGRHHRRAAELAVRLAPYPAVSPGHPLAISVRMDALHFFDERGDRIDVGWR